MQTDLVFFFLNSVGYLNYNTCSKPVIDTLIFRTLMFELDMLLTF